MKKFVLPAQITINHQRYVHHEVCRNVEYIGHSCVREWEQWHDISRPLWLGGACSDIEENYWRRAGILSGFTHFENIEIDPNSLYFQHFGAENIYQLALEEKNECFIQTLQLSQKEKMCLRLMYSPRFFAVTPKLLLRSWVSLSVRDWWHPTKFSFMMNYTNRKSSGSTSPGQHMMIIISSYLPNPQF